MTPSNVRNLTTWNNGIDLVRSSRTIGHRSVSMEDYPFTLGNTGIDDDRVPASPPGSPAAETLTGMITDGVGRRSSPTAWAFDVNDPPLNHEQHAMVVEFSLESMTKVTCENRLPWVDFGWRWPRYPVTCAVSQRKP